MYLYKKKQKKNGIKMRGELYQVRNQKRNTSIRNGRRTFFFIMSYSKCVCLICQSNIAIPKKGNVEQHFRTVHRNYDTDFPPVRQHILYI